MKTFSTIAAQGEIIVRRIGDGAQHPSGYSPLTPENGRYIVGHSETGHHHVLAERGVSVAVMDRAPDGMRILHAIVSSPVPLVHLRDYDTHEPLMLEPGEYELRITREYDPYAEIARQQID